MLIISRFPANQDTTPSSLVGAPQGVDVDHPDGPVAHGEGDEDQGDSFAGKFLAKLQLVSLFIRTAIQVFSSFNLNL